MHPQTWDPDRYARNARFVAELGMPVVELLAPRPGERVLDLGCGDGVLTQKLAEAGCEVVGVDSSPGQVEAARSRDVNAQLVDCHELTFDGEFDAVFSNAALHWMQRPDRVIRGVHRALEPGGRFVAEFGGAGNVARIEAALSDALDRRGVDPQTVNPWYFPGVDEYRRRLRKYGFQVDPIELIPRPTLLPDHLVSWLCTFAESFAAGLPAGDRAAFFEEVQENLKPHLCDADGRWTVDYVRLRFAATKASTSSETRSTPDK